MKLKALFLLLALPLLAAAQVPHRLAAGDFMELKVKGLLNVDYVYSPDSAGTVLVYASNPDQLNWVEASGSGRKLTLSLKKPSEVIDVPTDLPRVRVYSSFLKNVENEGDSTVRVLSTAPVAEFSARVIGNGRIGVHNVKAGVVNATILSGRGIIALAGSANEASLKVTGAGVIQADGLQAKAAKVWCTGTGSIGVWATSTLEVSGAGAGTVYVLGAPEIKKHTMGIKLQPIE